MKRLVIRISVLVTVVVLGVIAIARAQRTVWGPSTITPVNSVTPVGEAPPTTPAAAAGGTPSGDSTKPATGSNPPALLAPVAGGDPGVAVDKATGGSSPPAPFTPVGDGAPQALPDAVHVNPLRPLHADVHDDVVATSGVASDPSGIGTAERAVSELPGRAVVDPFGQAARPHAKNASAASQADGPAISIRANEAGPGSGPARAGGPGLMAMRTSNDAGGDAHPRVGASGDHAPPPSMPPLLPTPSGSPPAAAESRAAAPAGEIPDAGEPARLGTTQGLPMDLGAGGGTGTPGGKQLEGAQSPQVTLEKTAPPEIQVGKPATFKIKVRNVGQVAASAVEIHDEIPKGTRLLSTNPQASQSVRGGELVWSLGTMPPGEERSVEVQVMPMEEGEIGSVATVQLGAQASARTVATKPQLAIEAQAPKQVLVGEPVNLAITVSNPGTGVATGVVLEERIPPGLQHPAGTELEYEIGVLKPKESRQLQLQLAAVRPGPVSNVLAARGEGGLKAEHRTELAVIAPQLEIAVDGPKRRFLEREAIYSVSISNPGTAPAQKVELVAQLPPGLKFVSANNAGRYDDKARLVHWQLDELPVKETGMVKVVTLPIESGEQKLHVTATTAKGLSAEKDHPVLVDGIAAVMFEVVGVHGPVEKGGETSFEIRVVNQGSKAATNVRVTTTLPPEMRAIAAEGPTRNTVEGNRVVFEGLSRLAPKADTTYRVRVKCLQAGDLRINVQLLSDEIRSPITKEESTRVYADE
jgi:uncharacterized repeat protein (TIGR01451 family)